MNCQRIQHQLSQCLDGRLPSAKRSEAMHHVDACETCAQVWAEMQAAHNLACNLDPVLPSPAFRDAVWNRIQSGEGTPEVQLHGPVTAATKLRYGLVGAAAAAALLIGVQFLTHKTDTPVITPDQVADNSGRDAQQDLAQQDLAQRVLGGADQSDSNPQMRRLRVRSDAHAADFGAQALTAGHLASGAVHKVQSAAQRLRRYRGRILTQAPLDKNHRQAVFECVRTIDSGMFVLTQLQRHSLLSLENSTRDCLAATRNTLDIGGADDARVVNLVRTLDNCRLDRLDKIGYTVEVGKIDQQEQIVLDMLSDASFRSRLIDLQLFQSQGAQFYIRMRMDGRSSTISSGPGIRAWRFISGPPASEPKQQPKGLQKKGLTRRD